MNLKRVEQELNNRIKNNVTNGEPITVFMYALNTLSEEDIALLKRISKVGRKYKVEIR